MQPYKIHWARPPAGTLNGETVPKKLRRKKASKSKIHQGQRKRETSTPQKLLNPTWHWPKFHKPSIVLAKKLIGDNFSPKSWALPTAPSTKLLDSIDWIHSHNRIPLNFTLCTWCVGAAKMLKSFVQNRNTSTRIVPAANNYSTTTH